MLEDVREELGHTLGRSLALPEPDLVDALRRPEPWTVLSDAWRYAARDRTEELVEGLRNTDGDPFEWVTEHWSFASAGHDELLSMLGNLEGVRIEEEDGSTQLFFFRSGSSASGMEEISLGHGELRSGDLFVETNSLPIPMSFLWR